MRQIRTPDKKQCRSVLEVSNIKSATAEKGGKMKVRKEAFSQDISTREHNSGLSLVEIPVKVQEEETLDLLVEETEFHSEIRSSMGMAVGSSYGAPVGISERVDQKGGTVISSTDRKKTVLIVAGPDDQEANRYASSLSSNYDVSMTSNILDCDKLFNGMNPEVLMVFVNKVDEREVLNYVKYLTDKEENKNLLVLAASRFEKLEERLQYYWAGIDSHVLLPASNGEIENVIQGWEV